MSITVTLPEGLFYLAPAILSTVVLLQGQAILAGRRRKRANIEYPQMYADQKQVEASRDAYLFNCAQRAHQNTLENIPIAWATTFVTAIKFPVFAAAALGFWSLSRVSYTRGYIKGDPKKRMTVVYLLGQLTLLASLCASIYVSGDFLCKQIAAKCL